MQHVMLICLISLLINSCGLRRKTSKVNTQQELKIAEIEDEIIQELDFIDEDKELAAIKAPDVPPPPKVEDKKLIDYIINIERSQKRLIKIAVIIEMKRSVRREINGKYFTFIEIEEFLRFTDNYLKEMNKLDKINTSSINNFQAFIKNTYLQKYSETRLENAIEQIFIKYMTYMKAVQSAQEKATEYTSDYAFTTTMTPNERLDVALFEKKTEFEAIFRISKLLYSSAILTDSGKHIINEFEEKTSNIIVSDPQSYTRFFNRFFNDVDIHEKRLNIDEVDNVRLVLSLYSEFYKHYFQVKNTMIFNEKLAQNINPAANLKSCNCSKFVMDDYDYLRLFDRNLRKIEFNKLTEKIAAEQQEILDPEESGVVLSESDIRQKNSPVATTYNARLQKGPLPNSLSVQEKLKEVDALFEKKLGPLHKAARKAAPEMLQAYTESGFEINFQNSYGQTALMMAARYDRPENVECLLNLGANIELKDKRGRNVFDYARRLKSPRVIEILNEFKKGGFSSPFCQKDESLFE